MLKNLRKFNKSPCNPQPRGVGVVRMQEGKLEKILEDGFGLALAVMLAGAWVYNVSCKPHPAGTASAYQHDAQAQTEPTQVELAQNPFPTLIDDVYDAGLAEEESKYIPTESSLERTADLTDLRAEDFNEEDCPEYLKAVAEYGNKRQ